VITDRKKEIDQEIEMKQTEGKKEVEFESSILIDQKITRFYISWQFNLNELFFLSRKKEGISGFNVDCCQRRG
jgi:hypothetical protein